MKSNNLFNAIKDRDVIKLKESKKEENKQKCSCGKDLFLSPYLGGLICLSCNKGSNISDFDIISLKEK